MNIILATGIYPPQVGGPAEYAFNFNTELIKRGHTVQVLSYDVEKRLPTGIRHLYFFFRVCWRALDADVIYAFDTYGVGVPSLFAAMIFRIPLIVRVGGDFLWESYIERTGDKIPLSVFYEQVQSLTLKEQVIFWLTKVLVRWVDVIVFTTEWQRDIWKKPYKVDEGKVVLVGNYYPVRETSAAPTGMNFIWAVRPIKLKNGDLLHAAFARLQKEYPQATLDEERTDHDGLMQRISKCYAVVLPSISEVCPNLIIDALKFGKPFLCTGDSGIYSSLKDVGVFVDPLSEDSVYEGLRTLADPVQYVQYTARVKVYTYTHSWEQITDELLGAHRRLIESWR